MLRRSVLSTVIVLELTLALIGCSKQATPTGVVPQPTEPPQTLASGAVVDNIRVGTTVECAPDPDCETRMTLAKDAAIARHGLTPGAIGAAKFYMPYIPPGATLGSGGSMIVVFDLDDGSHAAVHTFCMDTCFVVSPQPVQPPTLEGTGDHGPLVDPLVGAPRECASAEHPTCDEALQVAVDSATRNGFLTPNTVAKAHYYVINIAPGSPEAAATKAEYIVDIYIAGEHDVLAETAIGVDCETGACQVVPLTDPQSPGG